MEVDSNPSEGIKLQPYEPQQQRQIFEPPLSTQRYSWVKDFMIQNADIESVTDFGCGNGRITCWLKAAPNLRLVNCVDADLAMLEYELDNYFSPNLSEIMFGRQESNEAIEIRVYHGDLVRPDKRLSADCITMVELVEHLPFDHVQRASRTIFGYYQPRYVVVTTPNSEFNHLLRQEGESATRFRHYDHKFEWTRSEFAAWGQEICSQFPYSVTFDGVGSLPNSEPYGYCTQIAIFRRNNDCTLDEAKQDLICCDNLLDKLEMSETDPKNESQLKNINLLTEYKIPGLQFKQYNDTKIDWSEFATSDTEISETVDV